MTLTRYTQLVKMLIRKKIKGNLRFPLDCGQIWLCWTKSYDPIVAAECAIDDAIDAAKAEAAEKLFKTTVDSRR